MRHANSRIAWAAIPLGVLHVISVLFFRTHTVFQTTKDFFLTPTTLMTSMGIVAKLTLLIATYARTNLHVQHALPTTSSKAMELVPIHAYPIATNELVQHDAPHALQITT